MTAPRFSVLVPTYNQAQYLPAALDSLRASDQQAWVLGEIVPGTGEARFTA